jgi:hypothetical protein
MAGPQCVLESTTRVLGGKAGISFVDHSAGHPRSNVTAQEMHRRSRRPPRKADRGRLAVPDGQIPDQTLPPGWQLVLTIESPRILES